MTWSKTGDKFPLAGIVHNVSDAKCQTRNVRREMSDAKYQTRNIRREISDAKYQTRCIASLRAALGDGILDRRGR